LYGYFFKILADGTRMDLCVYVDDGFYADEHSPLAEAELDAFEAAGFTLQRSERPEYFLGCNVTVHNGSSLSLTMRAYVLQLAVKYLPKPLQDYKLYHTPATKELTAAYETALLRADMPSMEFLKSYGSKVGAMIYAAPTARFDCAQAIGICARALTFPTVEMDACADRIIAYMAQHADDGVTYDGNAVGAEVCDSYSDSDWGIHSTTGWCIVYANAAIAWASKRQHCIALSSTEAEIMAASMAATEILYTRGVLREMGVDVNEPTVLYVDNKSAIELAKDRKSCQRSRHIERRFLKIRELVAEGHIIVKYVNTTRT
jgi:hypothetical protein